MTIPCANNDRRCLTECEQKSLMFDKTRQSYIQTSNKFKMKVVNAQRLGSTHVFRWSTSLNDSKWIILHDHIIYHSNIRWWTYTCIHDEYIQHHIHNQIEYVFITNMMNTSYIHLSMMMNIYLKYGTVCNRYMFIILW